MANVKISQLPSLPTMTDASEIPVVSSGTTYKITGSTLEVYFTGNVEFAGTTLQPRAGATESNITLKNGTSAVDILAANGNVGVTAGSSTWTFDNTGNLTAPGGISATGNITAGNLDAVNLVINRISSDDSTFVTIEDGINVTGPISGLGSSKLDFTTYGANTAYLTTTSDDTTALFMGLVTAELYANTDVSIRANTGGTAQTWTFNSNGTTTFPTNVSINYSGNNVQFPRIIADSGKAFSVQAQGNTGSAALAWTVDPDVASQYAQVGVTRGGDNLAKVILQAQSDSGNAATAKTWTFNEAGNLTLPGNTFAVNYANGTQVALGGGSGNTGNVTFNDQIVLGTGTNDGGGGLYLAPGNASIANSAVQYLRVRGGDVPTHIHLDTGNNDYYDQYFGDDAHYVKLANIGNVVIGAANVGSSAQWSFDPNGTLVVPAANGVPGQISTATTQASEKGFDLRITAGNTDGCSVSGGDVYLSAGVGYNGISHNGGNVNIVTGDRYGNIVGNIWKFGSTGILTLPLGSVKIKDTVGNSVAFGLNAGFSLQGMEAVAIGSYAGNNRQGNNSVAIGNTAGAGGSVSTNYVSGAESPSTTLVVVSTAGIGPGMIISGTGFFGNITVVTVTNSTTLEISASAGFTPSGTLTFTGSQGDEAVAIGQGAGSTNQGSGAVAVGGLAGYNLQGANAVAVGQSAGSTSQGDEAVAIGQGAGSTRQGADAVAIGRQAGNSDQGIETLAIGVLAGFSEQGQGAVAVGFGAGYNLQGVKSVAIGGQAGLGEQGANAIAIGYRAGYNLQAANTIILNATGATLNQTTANTFTVAPVRNDIANTANVMFYNATSKEITYGNAIGVAGNITGGNLTVGSGTITGGNVNGANFNGNVAFGTGTIGGSGNISAGNIITSSRVVTTPVAFSTLTAVTGARAFVNDGNLVAASNFGAQVSGSGSNTVPVWSDGANWYIG
jgi:hypothetical protein